MRSVNVLLPTLMSVDNIQYCTSLVTLQNEIVLAASETAWANVQYVCLCDAHRIWNGEARPFRWCSHTIPVLIYFQ